KVEDLEKVLLRTKNAMVKQYSKLFAMDGVQLRFTRDAVVAIARRALELKTGARALRAILEKLMLEVMYDLPMRDNVTEVLVDQAVVEGRRKPILKKATRRAASDKNAA
ncbi:MAG TPA: ATP-dependent Clp protease ATP-binding subunit ClpX, partial [Candidatus Didemnitutus sp.]